MSSLERVVFGRVRFPDSEEFQEFRYRFLIVVMLSGALLTGLLVLGAHTGVNPLAATEVAQMSLFVVETTLLWLLLRGHKQRFHAVAWAYEICCLIEYTAALIFVPNDELRILWFLVNLPGVYILLGQRAGGAITALTVLGLGFANSYLAAPYSPNAMATLLLALIYVGVIFHVYGARSISYFLRMRDSNRRLQEMASHDPLTGTLNARAYYALCDRLIRLAGRSCKPFSVLFVDLDHFKAVNDTHGHAAGDIVLKAVALTLGERLRSSDALGRIGGEEFSIFLPDTNLEQALAVAEKLRQAIEALLPQVGDLRLRITASIGVASQPDGQAGSMLEIQQRADQAMYLAKAGGRNRVSSLQAEAVAEKLPA